MGQSPTLVLTGGLLTAGMGVALLAVSGRVEGLVWLATAVIVLGLCLVGLWFRSRLSSGEATPPHAAERLPGRWYPYAIVGVGVALGAWVVFWTKFR
jgi:hypothetical protein